MTPGSVLIRPGRRKRRPTARSPFVGSGPGKANLVGARPGAVWDPTGGSGRFPSSIISAGAGAHACVEWSGIRWPHSTYAISARSRPGLESRSRRDRVCASRPPKPVSTYLSVRSSPWRYDLRRESYWAARRVPNGARPRTHIFRPSRARTPQRVSARSGADCAPGESQHDSRCKSYLQEPECTLR